MKQQEIQQLINEQQSIILDREAKLKGTDYIGVKIAEGAATKTEYADIRAQRQEWRNEINAAMAEISELEKIIPEEDEHHEE